MKPRTKPRTKSTARAEAALRDALDLFKAWGSQGGKVGGKLRWKGTTVEQRRAHAKMAAAARWAKTKKRV
jgi:hypothetical protein